MAGYTYAMSDIHNDYVSFKEMLELIHFSQEDKLYIIGDIFDRGTGPVSLYFEIKKYPNIIPIKGNHDAWFSEFIKEYHAGIATKYFYNTFELMKRGLTDRDLLEVGKWIDEMPLYVEATIGGKRFLMAHAQTAKDMTQVSADDCLMGTGLKRDYLENGIEDVVSIIGHTVTNEIRYMLYQPHLIPYQIWHNDKKNLYAIDCGNGYRRERMGGRLACLRVDDMVPFYV